MLHARFRICSALLLASVSAACVTTRPGPLVDVCLSDSANKALQCVGKSGEAYTLPLPDNYVCFQPDDFEALATWCARRCDK
jgi:hypothetical protein